MQTDKVKMLRMLKNGWEMWWEGQDQPVVAGKKRVS
jgi:hypothetical protein